MTGARGTARRLAASVLLVAGGLSLLPAPALGKAAPEACHEHVVGSQAALAPASHDSVPCPPASQCLISAGCLVVQTAAPLRAVTAAINGELTTTALPDVKLANDRGRAGPPTPPPIT